MFIGQIFLGKFPNLGKMGILLTRKDGIKKRACETQAGSLVRAASGEFGEGGSPARNRAASSAVAVSEQLARAAPNATVKVIRIVAIIRVAVTDTFAQRAPIRPDG